MTIRKENQSLELKLSLVNVFVSVDFTANELFIDNRKRCILKSDLLSIGCSVQGSKQTGRKQKESSRPAAELHC